MQILLLLCLVAFSTKKLLTKISDDNSTPTCTTIQIFRSVVLWWKKASKKNNEIASIDRSKEDSQFSDFEIKEVAHSSEEGLKINEDYVCNSKQRTDPLNKTSSFSSFVSFVVIITEHFKFCMIAVWCFFWQIDKDYPRDFMFTDFSSHQFKDSFRKTSMSNQFFFRSSLVRRGKTVSPFRPNDIYAQTRSLIQRKLLRLESFAIRNKKYRKLTVITELPELENLA